MLNKVYLQDFNGIRRYLLEKTQHMIGGFGKLPGDLPGVFSSLLCYSCSFSRNKYHIDILHSYLGLATLATMREPDLRSLDPTLCISVSAREVFEQNSNLHEGVLTNGSMGC